MPGCCCHPGGVRLLVALPCACRSAVCPLPTACAAPVAAPCPAGRELRQADIAADGGDELLLCLFQAQSALEGADEAPSSGTQSPAAAAATATSSIFVGAAAAAGDNLMASLEAAAAQTGAPPAKARGASDQQWQGMWAALLQAHAARMVDPFDWVSPAAVDLEGDRWVGPDSIST